jgi:hypothetical protein
MINPWYRIVLEKLKFPQLIKICPAFYGTRRFITVFTNALTWAVP